MASTSSSSVLHGEAPEASDMEFQEHQLVVRMPHSVTTVASSSSSRSELHRTFNQSEEQQIFRMGSEEQQTLDTEFHGQRDVSMASNDHEQTSVVSSSEIHRPIDGNSKGQQILDIELEGKRDFDTGTEARQVYSKESEQHNALDTRSEEVYEATDIPQPSLFLAKDEDGGVSSQPVGEKQDEYVTGIRLVLVLAAITIVYFLIMLDNTIIATAIPYITDEFHSLLDVGWYGSAYQLSS
ncbi:hypothetical protein F4677DRAFT_31490 [Hypoxylon crocopeplum]|nr:hypothetical protein F4677DRAFT_31490 [Hypoxylon crocopeplum]